MQVYEMVHKYIIEHGINQGEIAKKCNLSVSVFGAMMTGNRKMYAEDLRAICYALEVSPEEFIEFRTQQTLKEDE